MENLTQKQREEKAERTLQDLLDFEGKVLYINDIPNLRSLFKKVFYRNGSDIVLSPEIEIKWDDVQSTESKEKIDKIFEKGKLKGIPILRKIEAAISNPFKARTEHEVGQWIEIPSAKLYKRNGKRIDAQYFQTRVNFNRFCEIDIFDKVKNILFEQLVKKLFGKENPKDFALVLRHAPEILLFGNLDEINAVAWVAADKINIKNNVVEVEETEEYLEVNIRDKNEREKFVEKKIKESKEEN